jgi:hypothetical protein
MPTGKVTDGDPIVLVRINIPMLGNPAMTHLYCQGDKLQEYLDKNYMVRL